MMRYIDTSRPVDIPNMVARCPECNGSLWVEVTEWETEDGAITEGGFDIHCEDDEREPDLHFERWVQDWHPVENKVYQWLLDNVRVADATEGDLKAWNEAIRDWAIA